MFLHNSTKFSWTIPLSYYINKRSDGILITKEKKRIQRMNKNYSIIKI